MARVRVGAVGAKSVDALDPRLPLLRALLSRVFPPPPPPPPHHHHHHRSHSRTQHSTSAALEVQEKKVAVGVQPSSSTTTSSSLSSTTMLDGSRVRFRFRPTPHHGMHGRRRVGRT
eukprot:scaffold3567_cov26-Tisochrysis_lutea.AAC.4